MIWYRINNRWYIDVTQIREFGKPADSPDCISITFKDGKTENYQVDDQDEQFDKLVEFIELNFISYLKISPNNDVNLLDSFHISK